MSGGFFDAHCDAAMKVVDEGADFVNGGQMHVSLPALERAGVRVQIFASCAIYPETPRDGIVSRGVAMVDAVWEMATTSGGRMSIVKTASDMRRALEGGSIGGVIALEGADPLEGKAEALRWFVERGVRSIIFAWQDNEFSGTAFGTARGLSREGERLLGLAEELSVVVDVSHLSDQAFADVRGAASRPFIASHSNCRALCAHPRNLTDAMIRELADRGGVMGINLAPHFLSQELAGAYAALRAESERRGNGLEVRTEIAARRRALPRPTLDLFVRHVLHAIQVGGEDAVGLGGDLDGIDVTPAGIESVADYALFPRLLRDAGLSERQIEKITHANFARVFGELLP